MTGFSTMSSITYEASGAVVGSLWGGGIGSYPTVTIRADTLAELHTQAQSLFESGELDGGMGFESLVSAYLDVKEIETREIDGKVFTAIEYSDLYLGDEKWHYLATEYGVG